MHNSVGGGDSSWTRLFSHFSDLRDLDLDLLSGHTAFRCVSLIDFYLYIPNFVLIGRTFLWTDESADKWMDIETGVLTRLSLCRLLEKSTYAT